MTLTFLIGPSLSGKSCYTEQYKENSNYVIVSSDKTREELGLKVYNPKDNNRVFKTIKNKIFDALHNGKSVIYDATNINKKIRDNDISFFKSQFPELKIKAVVFNINPDILYARSSTRNKEQINFVPKEIIDKQLIKFKRDYPKSKDFDEMEIITDLSKDIKEVPKSLDKAILDAQSNENTKGEKATQMINNEIFI